MTHHFTQTCAYFTAARYMRSIEQLADKIYAPTGMKPAYAYIMMTLEDSNPLTIQQLSRRLGYERSSISRMVKTLAAKQLVTLTPQGRATLISLSATSAAFLQSANDCLMVFGQTTTDLLGDQKAPMTKLLTSNNQKIREELS
ncbi:MarR family winged helix-turn-helix transcriptional regulator [Levilactobacillus fujinensis]|uniref:MarR family winged helix-turn-helix transcriptional regulator n=1 Tax=Levilactobacillus fujinensis TaxID=2486024 RepID=A0ABW1TIC8_9LACO|nr:MarR family transcriptional regulator [Levilactobacillus fujinensis]